MAPASPDLDELWTIAAPAPKGRVSLRLTVRQIGGAFRMGGGRIRIEIRICLFAI